MSKADDFLCITRVNLLGDKTAFDQLTRKYQSSIRRFFLNLTMGDSQLSDDLAQETFIKAYLGLRTFNGLSAFSTWLFRIAYNVFYDSARARKYTIDIEVAEIDKNMKTDNMFSPEKTDIYSALKQLRNEERTAMLLFYMEDKTHPEIAKIMNCPLGTVKTHILKGKQKVGEFLKSEGYEHAKN
jgi:RNA polymerase sigma-70 factor (ECF subfamily)